MILKGLISITAAALTVISVPANAAEEVLFGPVPEWVEPQAQGEASETSSSLPVQLLLLDQQERLETGRQQTYSAFVMKFQTPQGLSSGNLTFSWRPEFDDLTVHKVLIRRGEEEIDVLDSGQSFTVVRREQDLEAAILDGVLTATMFPEGLQVGDVLEVATTLTSSDPVLAGHGEAAFGPVHGPVARAHFQVQWPRSRQVRMAKSDDLPQWTRSREGDFETASLEFANDEAVSVPDDAPIRYGMVRFAEVSTFSSWAELAEIFVPLYETAAQIPADGPLRDEVERIRGASSDPVARAEAALALVQNRIRYVALAMGPGGLVPASAADTWSRRYGDCKGKSALLIALLRELGIEAEPVLVNTVMGGTLEARLPNASAFDHVLVRAHIGGREYWLDGTRTGDTGLDRLKVPYYRWGLPVLPRTELVRMVPQPLEEPAYDVAIHVDASQGVHAPAPARIDVTMRGDLALSMNQHMANFAGEARNRTLREYWRRLYDFVEPHATDYSFDEATGEAQVSVEGLATLEWDGVWLEVEDARVGYNADFTREAEYARDAPYTVAFPFFNRSRHTIILPPGFFGTVDADTAIEETVGGIEIKRHGTVSDDRFFVETSERSVVPEFPAEDAPAAQKRLRELNDSVVYLRIPPTYQRTEADLAIALERDPDDVRALIDQGNQLLNAGKYREALEPLIRATELEPENGIAWANMGVALAWQDQFEEAVVALDKAEAADPENWVIFNGRGIVAERKREWDAAIAAFTRAIELNPANQFAMFHRANTHFAAHQPEQALADAGAALELNPKLLEMYSLRSFIHSQAGRKDEAIAEATALLEAMPDDPIALGAAAQIYQTLGMGEEAGELSQQALANEPDAYAFYNLSRSRDIADVGGRLEDLGQALRLDPEFAAALFDRASLYFRELRYEEALADTERALELQPEWPEVNVLRANIFTRMGRKEEALAEAEAVVAANPDTDWAYVAAGKIYAHFEQREDALRQIDKAIAMQPHPLYYIDRSQVRDPDDLERRLADINIALELAPGEVSALYAKSDILSDMEDYGGAAKALTQILEFQPNDPNALNSRAIALVKAGRAQEAEADFDRARSLAKDAMALNNLCYPKAVAGVALDRALEECEASLEMRSDFPPTLDSRGAVLLRLGRFDEAIRDFDRVLEQMPNMMNSRYLRAVAHSAKGDHAKAQADLEVVQDANPDLIQSMERNEFRLLDGPAEARSGAVH